jgi:hypothetical protein
MQGSLCKKKKTIPLTSTNLAELLTVATTSGNTNFFIPNLQKQQGLNLE